MVSTFTMLDVLRDTIVGSDAGTGERVYLSQVPQDASYPYAVIEVISRTEAPTQDVGSAVDEYRVQIDIAAKPAAGNSAQLIALQNADAVRLAISRIDLGANGFYSVQETNMRTDYLPELGVFIASNDYIIRVVSQQGD
jgi:hypothetical protein